MPLDPLMQHRTFPFRRPVATRSDDVNAARHVAATALMSILENERTAMLIERFGYTPAEGDGCAMIHLESSFLQEVLHPATLEAATGIERIGRTSFAFVQALFQDGACVSLSLATYVNLTAAGASPMDEARRAALTANLVT